MKETQRNASPHPSSPADADSAGLSPGERRDAFRDRLRAVQQRTGSALCVGIDVDPRRLPEGISRDRAGVERFIRGIIDATADLVCTYKPNLAFFEALGEDGPPIIRSTLAALPEGVLSIADGKRGDLGNTAERYATAIFDVFGFDAATVNPYQGSDSVEPYLQDASRGAFLLCKTSNPGSVDFQDVRCESEGEMLPLFELVARRAVQWNVRGNVGLVVGVTFPDDLARIRRIAPDLAILVPGVGAQGGNPEDAIRLGTASDGTLAVVNASRQVLYASSGPDWQEAARREALALRQVLQVPGSPPTLTLPREGGGDR